MMPEPTPGPGSYTLTFHVRHKRQGILGTGDYQVEFDVPADQDLAYGSVGEAVAGMVDHIAELIGIPIPEECKPDAPGPEPEAPGIATGPNGEFPPDLELIYQAFKARSAAENN